MRIEHWFYALPLRIRSLFHREQVEQDLNDELEYHLERKIEENIAQGMTPEQSRRAALRAMDGLAQRKEECRDVRRVNAIENTVKDLRFSLRVLRKSPGFTIAAVLTLAMGIGANAVVFGVLNALILRPLNVPRVESLWGTVYGADPGFQSYANYVDLRDRNRSFDGLAAFGFTQLVLDSGKDPALLWGYATSGNYFDVLGVQPYLGRFFHASDEHGPNSAPYIVLTYAYWHAHFQDDRGVVGRVVRLNKHPFTIIGVAPPEFRGTLLFVSPNYFLPIVNQDQLDGGSLLDGRGDIQQIFETFGHLRPGVTPAQAVADLKSVGAYLQKTYPKEFAQKNFSLARTGLTSFGDALRAFLTALMLLAGLILVAACANLGSLFAAHAADRSREIALRLALGSSRSRIVRQLLTEAMLIALLGGALGLWGSVNLLHSLSVWRPFPAAPVQVPVSPDATVYIVAMALALASGFVFGIVPVRGVLKADPYQIVKSGSTGTVGRRVTVRDILLGVQIAICAVLVTSSMVAVRGLMRSLHANFGFEPRNTMLVTANLALDGYTGDTLPAMHRRMIDALRTIPGVERAGLVNNYPPLVNASAIRASVFRDEARDLGPSNVVASPYRYDISPEYFQAASTALLVGRDLTWYDDKSAPRVAVVNREFAGKMFGSLSNAIGKYYRMQDGTRIQVVGVVENGKYLSVTEDQQPAIFLPFLQSPSGPTCLVVRSRRDPQELAAAMRGKLRALDAGMALETDTWNSLLNVVLFPSRVATVALGVLGLIGAMLSITGIFGMAANSVSRRLKELGIRLALGAQPQEVLQAALGRAFKLLAVGSAAGLLLGLLATRVLASIVYQATPRDPLVLAGVVLIMLLVGLLATWIPAQRALSLDPLRLLREE